MNKPITRLRARVHEGAVHLTWYQSTPAFKNPEAQREFDRFRIHRLETPAFTFGKDYEEFFLGLTAEGAEIVYDGALPAHNERKYAFVDDTAQIGTTYAYFVQSQTSAPVGPVPVRVRDPEIYWTVATLRSRLGALAEDTRVSLTACGQTGAGRDIPCITVGDRGPTVGLVGLIHPGEAGPELIVPALETLVHEQPALFDGARVVAIPAVNLDGREQMAEGTPWYLRTTPGGVDLNRNFPARWDTVELGYGLDSSDPDAGTYRGERPASAPETRAVMSVFEATPPSVVFSMHCLASICGMPALAPRDAADDTGYAARCAHLVSLYASALYGRPAEVSADLRFGTSAGSLPLWLYDNGRIPAFDLEGGQADHEKPCVTDLTDRALLERCRQGHTAALAAILNDLGRNGEPA